MLFVNVTICQIGQWAVHCWCFIYGICFEHTNYFKWPEKDDVLQYDDDDIICEIDALIPVNQRNNFVLSATDFENANAMMTKIEKFLEKMMFLMDNEFFDVV